MSLKLLIVEDEADLLNSMKQFFEMMGYIVFATSKGDAALNVIEKEKPPVIVLDLNLKGSNITGLDVLKMVSEKYPDIKVIITTGYGADKDIQNMCERYKPYKFLGKPLSLAELSNTLEEISKQI